MWDRGFRSEINGRCLENNFNSHIIGSGSEELMIYMLWLDDNIDMNWSIIMREMKNGNNIGDSGGCSIGEALKVNSSLTFMNLAMRG